MPPHRSQKNHEENSADYSARLEAVLNTVIDGIITINDRGIIQSFNPSAERIFGYKPEEVIGQNVKVLMPEPYHSEHDGYLKNYNSTGHKKVIGIGREVRARRRDGNIFPMELGINEMQISGEKMFVGTIRDISERKQAEQEIMRSNEELERFAYIASHDLQEPLRMIASFTAMLESEYREKMDEQASEYMQFIISATQRMQNLVSDILEYSRIGYQDANFCDVDCSSHARLALTNLKDTIQETSADITLGDMPVIHASPTRFVRLIQNLVGNALKYRSEDRAPQIIINAVDNEDEWLFSVQDNGIGMKGEYLEQIFIIFKRLHGKQEYSGTGIGLAVCRKIVESFHGRIWATSSIGQGSTFYFTVPKKQEQKNLA